MRERKLILSMQVTLDGFVSGPNDEMDWLINTDDDWKDLFGDIDLADVYLLGRKMYPGYADYWRSVLVKPDSDPNELRFAKLADKTQHVVFTRGAFTPDWSNTRVAHDLVGEVSRLKKEKGGNMIAWGGAGFAASLMDLDLVDEYRFALNPTILTEGKALFSELERRNELALIEAKGLPSGLAVLRYGRGKG